MQLFYFSNLYFTVNHVTIHLSTTHFMRVSELFLLKAKTNQGESKLLFNEMMIHYMREHTIHNE